MPILLIPPRIPRPVLENEQLQATVRVPSRHVSFLPEGAEIVGTEGEYTIALIRMDINVVYGGYGEYIILNWGSPSTATLRKRLWHSLNVDRPKHMTKCARHVISM